MEKTSKILITGSTGLFGSAVVRQLKELGYTNLLIPSRFECDLLNKYHTVSYFVDNKPEYIFHCAGKVGGIVANNTYPIEFFEDNMQMALSIFAGIKRLDATEYKIKKALLCASTCVYPKDSQQPIKEEYLLTAPLEPTNEAYALAKIGLVKLGEYYKKQKGYNIISVFPTNLYGKYDSYHPKYSHVLPAIIRKVVEAKQQNKPSIEVWGDGSPIREFMFADDAANSIIYLMENYNGEQGHINIGTGKGITIKEAYETTMKIVGYNGQLILDTSKPNGTPVKITDVTKLNNLGWKSKISFEEGILTTLNHLKETNYNWKEK